jgi:ribosomal protein L37AE/L43A
MRDNERPNAGWKLEDRHYLHRYDNAQADPELQILTEEDWEDENLGQRQYWCAICKSRLDFLKETGTMWRCNECMEYYDTKIQDVPVKSIKDSRVKTYPELSRYPTEEEDDVFTPFIEGINPDAEDEEYAPSNVEGLEDDGHHKKIRVKGLPIETLSAMRELDGRE